MATKETIQDRPLIFTVDNVLDKAQCQMLIDKSEQDHQYSQAQITVGYNQFRKDTDMRNNDRVIFDDAKLAEQLFALVKPFLPDVYKDLWHLKGLNDRLRFYRYSEGQIFKIHFDAPFERNENEKSFLTLIFYLNDSFEGGETAFFHYRGSADKALVKYKCFPKQGKALIFDHKQLHEGSEVTEGMKYVLRTDVMYEVLQFQNNK